MLSKILKKRDILLREYVKTQVISLSVIYGRILNYHSERIVIAKANAQLVIDNPKDFQEKLGQLVHYISSHSIPIIESIHSTMNELAVGISHEESEYSPDEKLRELTSNLLEALRNELRTTMR